MFAVCLDVATEFVEDLGAFGSEEGQEAERALLQGALGKQRCGDFVFVSVYHAGAKAFGCATADVCAGAAALMSAAADSSATASGLGQARERAMHTRF